jgi:hypothetical protein
MPFHFTKMFLIKNQFSNNVVKYYYLDLFNYCLNSIEIGMYIPLCYKNDTMICRKDTSYFKIDPNNNSIISKLSNIESKIFKNVNVNEWKVNDNNKFAIKLTKKHSDDINNNKIELLNINTNKIESIFDKLKEFEDVNCYKCFWIDTDKLILSIPFPDNIDYYSLIYIYDIYKKVILPIKTDSKIYDIYDYNGGRLLGKFCDNNNLFFSELIIGEGIAKLTNIEYIKDINGDNFIFLLPNVIIAQYVNEGKLSLFHFFKN